MIVSLMLVTDCPWPNAIIAGNLGAPVGCSQRICIVLE